jgi:hypothetical protein
MTNEGALNIEWIKSPQQARRDAFRISFETYQRPEQQVFTWEMKSEGEVKAFLLEEIGCTEDAIADALKDLGRRARTKINHIQLSDEILHKLRGGPGRKAAP